MKCVVCEKYQVFVINTRPSLKYNMITRTYECKDCLTKFKTEEKVMFSSIPADVRNRFLETGKRRFER